jgi:hypothetical protein
LVYCSIQHPLHVAERFTHGVSVDGNRVKVNCDSLIHPYHGFRPGIPNVVSTNVLPSRMSWIGFRFVADLPSGTVFVFALRYDGAPELLCTLFMAPELLKDATPMAFIRPGGSAEIYRVE